MIRICHVERIVFDKNRLITYTDNQVAGDGEGASYDVSANLQLQLLKDRSRKRVKVRYIRVYDRVGGCDCCRVSYDVYRI